VAEVLAGRELLREELAAEVEARLPWAGEKLRSGWGSLLHPAAIEGNLCFGRSRGAKVTFTRPDTWLGAAIERPPPEQALAEVCRRYLGAYGPARAPEFAAWFGLEPGQARAAFGALDLTEVSVEGKRGFVLAGDDAWDDAEPSVRLLPRYDCYLLGARFGREHVLPEPIRERAGQHGRGRHEGVVAIPTVLVDGVVAGFWELRGKELTVELHARGHRAACRREAARIGAFLGVEPRVVFDTLAW
jgi:hypothetical protein